MPAAFWFALPLVAGGAARLLFVRHLRRSGRKIASKAELALFVLILTLTGATAAILGTLNPWMGLASIAAGALLMVGFTRRLQAERQPDA